MINQAVILAGGRGERLRPFTLDNPKPMYVFEGKPFLEHIIIQLTDCGIKKVLLLLGYLPEKIVDYFGNGSKWGIDITYDITPAENETAARLYHAKPLIEDNFLLLYCDNYCHIDFYRAWEQYKKNNAMLQLTAYENSDCYSRSNIRLAEDYKVDIYDKSRKLENLQYVDIGYAFASKKVLEYIPNENVNFEAEVYPKLLTEGKLHAYIVKNRYYSVGSYERINLTKEFFTPKKVAFLDRDGTINRRAAKAEYISKAEDFTWIDGAKEAINLLKENGYILILVTNQPGIARGMLKEEELENIHRKMQEELGENRVDKIYYCPHGWDEGCECRKPKAGMLYQAGRDLSLDLTKCILIGDDERDIMAAQTAGCKGYLVSEGKSILDIVKGIIQYEYH